MMYSCSTLRPNYLVRLQQTAWLNTFNLHIPHTGLLMLAAASTTLHSILKRTPRQDPNS